MKKVILILLAIAGFVGLIMAKQIKGDDKQLEVTTVVAAKGEIKDSILASGNLVFNTQVQLRSEVTGRVEKVYVEEGQRVEKGDILMVLDTDAFEAEVKRFEAMVRAGHIEIKHAQTRLENLERQLKRQKNLYDAGLTQQETFENVRNQRDLAIIDVDARRESLKQAEASLSIAKDRLSKSVFRATMGGLLASVDIKEGETVIAGTTNIVGSDLMLLADPSAILAELKVDETDIANIKLNQEAEIYAAAYPNQPFKGKVTHIGTAAKRFQGSQGLAFKVKVLLAPDERTLYAGMSCRAEIATAVSSDDLKLPIEAVQIDDDKHYVWVLDKANTVSKREVKVGVASDVEQAVLEGLSPDETVIVGPARAVAKLEEGITVKVKSEQQDKQDGSNNA